MNRSDSKIELPVKLNLLVNCNSFSNRATTGVCFGECSYFLGTSSASQLVRKINSTPNRQIVYNGLFASVRLIPLFTLILEENEYQAKSCRINLRRIGFHAGRAGYA